MRIVHREFDNFGCSTILIGRVGENNTTRLEVDISKVSVGFPNPMFEMMLKTPAFDEPYPLLISISEDGSLLYYDFSSADLKESGFGEIEILLCSEDGSILKSKTARIRIDNSIITGRYPGPIEKIINELREMIDELKDLGGVKTVTILPDDPEEDEIVYLDSIDSGFYRYDGLSWVRLTDTGLMSNVSTLLKLSETSGGQLLFDNKEIGSIPRVDSPNNLDDSYDNGSLAIALNDGSGLVPINYPEQSGSSRIHVDISGIPFVFGFPNYSESGLNVVLEHGMLPEMYIRFASNNMEYAGNICPIVSNLSDNIFTNAGITVSEENSIVAQVDDSYAIWMAFTDNGIDAINPTKIIQVDSSHISVPAIGIFIFSGLSGTINGIPVSLSGGWNIIRLTIDTSTYDVTDMSIESGVDVNEYLNIVPDDENDMTLEGYGATMLFADMLYKNSTLKKGLYIRLNDEWSIVDTEHLEQRVNEIAAAIDNLKQDEHTHGNKEVIDRFGGTSGELTYNGYTVPLVAEDDVTLLGFLAYDSLVLRDEVVNGESIQNVPVYVTGNIGNICVLTNYTGGENDDYIALAEVRQYDTGMPLRMLKVQIGGVYAAYIPETWNVNGSIVLSSGWIADDQPTARPTIEGFSPNRFSFGNDTYDNLDNLPKDVKSALYSLSQCINTSAETMGHIRVEDDSVLRFNGTIKPNQKYHFTTGNDCALNLPNVGFSETDSQFVIYLTCTSDVDFTFPEGTYFANTPNTETGEHKLIGSYLPKAGKWSIGGIDYEVAT